LTDSKRFCYFFHWKTIKKLGFGFYRPEVFFCKNLPVKPVNEQPAVPALVPSDRVSLLKWYFEVLIFSVATKTTELR
jgi:hypothetical protein